MDIAEIALLVSGISVLSTFGQMFFNKKQADAARLQVELSGKQLDMQERNSWRRDIEAQFGVQIAAVRGQYAEVEVQCQKFQRHAEECQRELRDTRNELDATQRELRDTRNELHEIQRWYVAERRQHTDSGMFPRPNLNPEP